MTKTVLGVLLGGALLLMAVPALAQQAAPDAPSQSMFVRDRNISVSQRPRPGYDAVPIAMGGFTGLPKLDLGVESNDNVYASTSNKHSDIVFTADPEFDLASRWSRNEVQAYARSMTRQYDKYTAESTTDWQVGGAGRLDIGHGGLLAGADTGEFTEPRFSPNAIFATAKPVRYGLTNAFLGATQELNRIRLTARYDYSDFDYHNGASPTGGFVLQDDRDHTLSTVTGKAEYAVSPATAVFIDASYDQHRYRLTPLSVAANKNSQGSQVNIGANFDLTNVARGEVEVGYLSQNFTAHVGTISGLSAKGKVEWFPTQLTTITLNGSRGLLDSAALGSPMYVAESVGLQADHELLRNFILTGRVGAEYDTYQGVDRKDRDTSGSITAKYLINRMVGVNLSYLYLNQDSSGTAKASKYTVNRITLSTTLQF